MGLFYSSMAWYKKNVLERQSFLEVKLGRGLSIFKNLCLQIVEDFQNNVPPLKICEDFAYLIIYST